MKSVERKKVINLYKHYIGVVETALSKEELGKVKAAYRYSDDLITTSKIKIKYDKRYYEGHISGAERVRDKWISQLIANTFLELSDIKNYFNALECLEIVDCEAYKDEDFELKEDCTGKEYIKILCDPLEGEELQLELD